MYEPMMKIHPWCL